MAWNRAGQIFQKSKASEGKIIFPQKSYFYFKLSIELEK
jgi:hypothetical protein